MKYLAILFLVLIACSADAKVIVRGKIIGYDGKTKITYVPTIEGIYAPYWHEVKPADNGTFRIEYENEGYGNIKVQYKNMWFRFFHDADSKIYFEVKEVPASNSKHKIRQEDLWVQFDSLKRANTVKITGDYVAINQFYNQNLRSSYFTTRLTHGTYYSSIIRKASTPGAAMTKLDSLTQIEILQIDKLPFDLKVENVTAEKKEKEIRGFLKNEVYSFYGAVFLNSMYLKRMDHITKLMKDSTINPDIYNRDWEVTVEKMREQMNGIDVMPNSPDYVDFVEAMAAAISEYKEYKIQPIQDNTMDLWVGSRFFTYDTTLLRDDKIQFEYELAGLNMFLDNQLTYSPTLLNAVNAIQEKHAGSKHLEFYQPKIDKLKNYLEKAAAQQETNSKIIAANYKSFNSLIKHFEGKSLFLDIWATWCGPCVEEFKYKSVVQQFVGNGDIEILYISIDKPQWEDRWKQSVSVNALEGSHFRGDKQFIEDMWTTIGGVPGLIPRYVLIDKQGKIFNNSASPPSSGAELTKQIQLLVDKK